jgi:apolipoprotein N-acyltransferase
MTEVRMSITRALPDTQPRLEAESDPLARKGTPILTAFLSSGLLWLCYFPAAWGWLAWVALVPLLTLVRSRSRAVAVYFTAYGTGLLFFLPAMQWMRVADPRMYYTWLGLSVYIAVYFPLAIFILRYLDRRTSLPLAVTLPVVWTALEFLRSHAMTGFSWYLLGHSQHDYLPIIQISDVTGAYGVSFLVAAVNGVVFEALWRWKSGDENAVRRPVFLPTIVAAMLLIGTLVYGQVRLGQANFRAGPRVALIQGNLDQQIKNQEKLGGLVLKHYERLSDFAGRYHPDLIVWPETSIPGDWGFIDKNVPPDAVPTRWREYQGNTDKNVACVHEKWPTNVLIGLNAMQLEQDHQARRYNSALLVNNEGDVAGRYDKFHRVPFGEYVPLIEMFPSMKELAPYDFDYSIFEGRDHTRFPLATADRQYTFGVVICYEDTVAGLALPYGGGSPGATDFIINTSNDGWFEGTAEHEEHLAICRFRAVECRRAVARSVNMGVSAVVDGNGRVLRPRRIPLAEDAGLFAGAPAFGSLTSYSWWALGSLVQTTSPKEGHAAHGPFMWAIPADPKEQEAMPTGEWRDYKKVHGVLLATIPLDHRTSLYVRWGDWLPWTCWGLLAVGVVAARIRRTRSA